MSTTKAWSGSVVRAARRYWEPRLPLPCWRCGVVLVRGGGWTVGHLVDRALGGSVTDVANQWPECARCNFSAGGRAGARKTNARRRVRRIESERDLGVRGW